MRRVSSIDMMPRVGVSVRQLRLKSWQLIHEASGFVVSERLQQMQALLVKYSPNQPRVPAGDSAGGQWTSGGGGVGDSGSETVARKPVSSTSQRIDDAVDHLKKNAEKRPQGWCAKYVRRALNRGGFSVGTPDDGGRYYAKNYGTELMRAGFEPLVTSTHPSKYPMVGYTPRKGDVMVMGSYPTQATPAGHMAMYTGKQWISDWPQRSFWPGSGYLAYKPSYTIYRYPQ